MREFLALSQPDTNSSAKQRFDANNFSMGGPRKGIFVQAARFNHSCVPNAHFTSNTIIQRLTVHAIIDIPAGTEIFLNYHVDDYTKTTTQRNHELRYYRFTCTCPACQINTPFGTASADRRTQMRNLKAELNRNRNSTQLHQRNERLGKIKAFGVLLRQEGLFYPQLADMLLEEAGWYRREMELAAAATQVEGVRYKAALRLEALKVARSKLDMDVLCTGYVSDEVETTLRLIEELKTL